MRYQSDHSRFIQNSPAVNAVDSTLSGSLTATMDATGAKLSSLTRRVDIVDSRIWSTPPFKNVHVFSRSAVGGIFAKSLAGAADNEAMMKMKEKVLSQLGKLVFPLRRNRHHACPTHRVYVTFKVQGSTLQTRSGQTENRRKILSRPCYFIPRTSLNHEGPT